MGGCRHRVGGNADRSGRLTRCIQVAFHSRRDRESLSQASVSQLPKARDLIAALLEELEVTAGR